MKNKILVSIENINEINPCEIERVKFHKNDKNKGFIYFLFIDDKVVYVGQTKMPVITRVGMHKDKYFESFSYLECDASILNDMEFFYVKKYTPKYNKRLPGSYKNGYLAGYQLQVVYSTQHFSIKRKELVELYEFKIDKIKYYNLLEISKYCKGNFTEHIKRMEKYFLK